MYQNMKLLVIATFALVPITSSEGAVPNLLNTPIHDCVKCLCHAVSGCYIRQNCARYSISQNYWEEAGRLTLGTDDPNSAQSYTNCMRDENCIVNTIKGYTDKFMRDCNCDGETNCKDRLAIHLSGSSCMNPRFGDVRANRFNSCVRMLNLNDVAIMRNEETDCVDIPAV